MRPASTSVALGEANVTAQANNDDSRQPVCPKTHIVEVIIAMNYRIP